MKFNYIIYVRLKSNHKNIINDISEKIKKSAESFNLVPRGIVILPANSKLYTVLRSPHVHKKARDQFELKIINRLLMFKCTSDALANLKFFLITIYNLAPSVQIKISFKKNYA